MPRLDAIPESTQTIFFGADGVPCPKGSKYLHLLCHLLEWPGMNQAGVVARLLREILTVPRSTQFYPGFKCLVGNIHCSEDVSLCDTFFVDYAPVYIGRHVGFSFKCMVITAKHDLEDFNRIVCDPVIIEDNVWIASGTTILSGVRIGANSVIGAGSVVTRDIPPNMLAAGNPCKPVRELQRGTHTRV